ncbi:pseudouridine synthase [Xylaria digitata]|nr:pseudouridine synthase [Xylaria digitata]
MATHTAMAQGSNASMRCSLEQHLGIIHFVSTKEHGWSGQSRTRYTDFQVNEITKDGEVVHLNDFYHNSRELARATRQGATTPSSIQKNSQPGEPGSTVGQGNSIIKSQELAIEENTNSSIEDPPKDNITESDKNALVDLVGQTTADELITFYTKIIQGSKGAAKAQGDVIIPTIRDKSQRSRVHGEIRRIFGGKIETTTSSNDSIKATASREGGKQRGNRSADTSGRNNRQNLAQAGSGPYLHFSLYKENKDTMDALNHMAKTLRIHPKAFGAAGTKDRRAVTVQRVSIKGRNPNSLVVVNERINNIKIGDFKYAQDPIRLNDHDGNEFVIVLKNCVFSGTENLCFDEQLNVAKSTIDSALTQVIQHGFINYYGTQRFGTHQIGTQEVGMKILKEDFAGAIQALLSYDPLLLHDSQDQDHAKGAHKEDINRARACSKFLETKNSRAALDYLPPRCHVEKTVIQHLGKSPTDFVGALMSINRSMRTMYGHAYQSLVWNFIASKRWERFGAQVINGDLVLVKSKSATTLRTNDEERDTEDSLVLGEDITATQNSGFVPHAVTEDDLQDGKYSIYDVVLPSPGWDVIYPPNEIGDFYAEFMGMPENGGLDPYNMRRRQRDFSLPGSYRKLIGKLKRVPTASVQAYSNDLEQLVPTDLDIIRSRKAKEATECNARQQNAATSWHTFTQNVHQNELEESTARIAYRESEDPTPPARINDTWVQTSVDGSNKRIRIAKHTNVCENKLGPVDMDGGDPMQREDSTQCDKPAETDENSAVVSQREPNHEVQDQQLAHKSLSSSIIAAVTAQPTHDELESRPSGATPQPPSTNGAATTIVDTNDPIPQRSSTSSYPHLDANSDSNEVASRLQPAGGAHNLQLGPNPGVPTPAVATEKVESAETGTIAPADSAGINKIAVILRFALDTSQYATIVIRELQGAPVANDNFAQTANGLTPNKDLTDSA